MIKNFKNFLNEADQPISPPPAQGTPPPPQSQTPPPVQPTVQPTVQQQQSGTTEQPPQVQPTPQQQGQGEHKSGDLSNYNNELVTKHPDTVKKIADLIKDMDKTQLIKLRNFIAELKDIEDPKEGIGKL
jgi:hypothetical protein